MKRLRTMQLLLALELLLTGCSRESCFPTYDEGELRLPDFCEDSMMIVELPDAYDWQRTYAGEALNEDCADWLVSVWGSPYKPYTDDSFWEKNLTVAAKSNPRFTGFAGYRTNKVLSEDYIRKCFGKTFFSHNTTDISSADIRKLFGVCSVSSMDDFLPEAKNYGGKYEIFYGWELYDPTYLGSAYDSGRISWPSDYCETSPHDKIDGIDGRYRRNCWAQKFYFMRKIDVYNETLIVSPHMEINYPVRTESYEGCAAFYPYAYAGNRFRFLSSDSSPYKKVRGIDLSYLKPETIELPVIRGLKFMESFTDANPDYAYLDEITVLQDEKKAAVPESETFTEEEMRQKTYFIPALDIFCHIDDDGTVSRIVNNPVKIINYYRESYDVTLLSSPQPLNALGYEGEDIEWFKEDGSGSETDTVSGKRYSPDKDGEYYRELDPAGNPTGKFIRTHNNVKRWRLHNSEIKAMKGLTVKAAKGTEFLTSFVVDPNDNNEYEVIVDGLTGDSETYTKTEMEESYFVHCKDIFAFFKDGKFSKTVNYPVRMTIKGAKPYSNSAFTYPPALPVCPGFRESL